jgi:Spy/CpxP family protein refolding chaperone
MKRNWLLYLVIFSLALNLGTIGTFAYLRYQDRQTAPGQEAPGPMRLRELWLALKLDPEQRQSLRQLGVSHRRQVAQLRRDLGHKRREMVDLLRGESPDWSSIQAKIREISAQQGRLEEEVARFLLECKKHLRPEQHTAFVDLVDRRLGHPGMDPCGPMKGPRGPRGGGPGLGPPGPRTPCEP